MGCSETQLVFRYVDRLRSSSLCAPPLSRKPTLLENFTSHGDKLPGILESNSIISATGNGKLGMIAAADIAENAYRALTVEPSYNTDILLVGPELLSYDEVHAYSTFWFFFTSC